MHGGRWERDKLDLRRSTKLTIHLRRSTASLSQWSSSSRFRRADTQATADNCSKWPPSRPPSWIFEVEIGRGGRHVDYIDWVRGVRIGLVQSTVGLLRVHDVTGQCCSDESHTVHFVSSYVTRLHCCIASQQLHASLSRAPVLRSRCGCCCCCWPRRSGIVVLVARCDQQRAPVAARRSTSTLHTTMAMAVGVFASRLSSFPSVWLACCVDRCTVCLRLVGWKCRRENDAADSRTWNYKTSIGTAACRTCNVVSV